jgi:site-specific DNA-methyltransferase (adenine-specific)
MSDVRILGGHNPDILTCLANLSADEVFTPPKLAAAMLDSLPQDLFRSPDTTFLDPFCKTGVFLREVAKRLNEGLRDQMPDEQARVDHILTKQVYGLAISELTAIISRRSVYCSKKADGKYSVATKFGTFEGNIRLPRTKHVWDRNGRCEACGARKADYERGEERETYAYPFIHGIDPRELFGVKFDVIVGNPPYQLSGAAGGTSDASIYHQFVEQAFKLEPQYATFVTPSRWLAGGRGMDDFRFKMLSCGKIRSLVDYPTSQEVFPGVAVEGGICYFLWEKGYQGNAAVTTIRGETRVGPLDRRLDEFDVFVRDVHAVDILHKVRGKNEPSIIDILTGDTPFGIATNFSDYLTSPRDSSANDYVKLHLVRSGKRFVGYVPRTLIKKNTHLIDAWKVLAPKAHGGNNIPNAVLGKPIVTGPGSVCTQTFIAFWVGAESEANSLRSYYCTKFFRFLVSLRKITQDALRGNYSWVPQQTWDRTWTDAELYALYGLTTNEVEYIESRIKQMEDLQ